MWIDQNNAVPDEMQDSIQKLQISIISGVISYPISIPKQSEFSQSILVVRAGGDIL